MNAARLISSGSFWAEGGLSGCDPMAAISPQCSDTCMLVFQLASVTNYAQLLDEGCTGPFVFNDDITGVSLGSEFDNTQL